jgi:hypothetical protein
MVVEQLKPLAATDVVTAMAHAMTNDYYRIRRQRKYCGWQEKLAVLRLQPASQTGCGRNVDSYCAMRPFGSA